MSAVKQNNYYNMNVVKLTLCRMFKKLLPKKKKKKNRWQVI